jgi:protein gp37
MKPEWVKGVRDHCTSKGIPFFFKQWGAFSEDGIRRSKKATGRLLDSETWDELPSITVRLASLGT